MKKFLMAAAVILLVAGFGLGGVGSYIYFSAGQNCAEMIERAENSNRTAVAAKRTAEDERLKKDAEYARQGAVFECENSKERKTNSLLFGLGAFVLIVVSAVLLFLSRRMK